MTFVVLGLVLLVIISLAPDRLVKKRADGGAEITPGGDSIPSIKQKLRLLCFLIIIGGAISEMFVFVPAGHSAVLLRFGAVQGSLNEGPHIIVPYINTARVIEVRTQKEVAEASASSRDLQIVTTQVALNYHLQPQRVADIYKRVGEEYREKIIDPAVQESVKMVTAQYTAEELVKQRADVKERIDAEVVKRLQQYDIIVEPMGLSITNFNFSSEFNQAIEQKQVAQQTAEKQKYVLQQAELERQTEVTRARGEAQAAQLRAAALQAKGGEKVIAEKWIAKWDGKLPLVGGSGNIIDVRQLMEQSH